MSKREDRLVIVAADCTGHGVPGAFMSMLGVSFLNEIVNKENEVYANEILNKLRDHVVSSLNQSANLTTEDEYRAKEGMDIALCVIDHQTLSLQYAGAYNPLILIRNGELSEIKADKMPVGYSDFYGNKPFTNNSVPLMHGDCIYMFSDGYADQFGGNQEKTKKFSSKRLKSALLEVSSLPMKEQEKIMEQLHDEWKGSNAQIDDVLLIGIRL
jgi:serine phosphatase RsbU (regulator of sigma subunit)